jgi:hypothetical protein
MKTYFSSFLRGTDPVNSVVMSAKVEPIPSIVVTFITESQTSVGVLNTRDVRTNRFGGATILLVRHPREGTETLICVIFPWQCCGSSFVMRLVMCCSLLSGEERIQIAPYDWKIRNKYADIAFRVTPCPGADEIIMIVHPDSPGAGACGLLRAHVDTKNPRYRLDSFGKWSYRHVQNGSLVAFRYGNTGFPFEPQPHEEGEYLTMPISSVSLYLT